MPTRAVWLTLFGLVLGAFASITAGVYFVAGLGYALIVLGIVLLALAGILRLGIVDVTT